MATYKYTQDLSTTSYGYVKFNINPDLGSTVLDGDLVTINGVVKHTQGRIIGIRVYAISSLQGSFNSVSFKAVGADIARNTEGEFSISFTMPNVSEDYIAGRNKDLYLTFDIIWLDGQYTRATDSLPLNTHKLIYLTYRVITSIRLIEFDRYLLDSQTQEYSLDNEGTSVFGSFALTIDEDYDETDITSAIATITRDDGVTSSITIPSTAIASALTSSGYVEDAPAIFSSYTFDTAYNYTINFSFGDAYDQVTASVYIARAFANMHLSGNPIGGVAFGKFAVAGLFECNYPAYFYKGINVSGTPWTDLPVSSNVTTPDPNDNGDGKLRYMILGGMVFIRGGINVQPSSSPIIIATLPSGYRPSGTIYRTNVAEGASGQLRRANFYIDSNGGLYLYSVTTESGTKYTSAAIWIDCAMSFAVDD